jgi:protein-L-isoaspartate(D-aspartate) O-methyltransferase
MIPDWASERNKMVERQLCARGIHDERVVAAVLQIPREEFVPPESRILSYSDNPLPIGYGQTISQPYMIALMAQVLQLNGTETVLDIGAGSGYHAAVLGVLAAKVISVEIVPAMAALAQRNLQRTGRAHNIDVILADGSAGYAPFAPYHAISVAAGAPEVPSALLDQLRDPGILVIPVGDKGDQELRVVQKKDGRLESTVAAYCRFVPLRGSEGWRR